jgi:3-deoxy-D-manno-octulosonic acid kinase
MIKASEIKTIAAYSIGSSISLTDGQLGTLCRLCQRQTAAGNAVLSGRASASNGRIDGIGPVVVKAYMRGGVVRHLMKRHYLKFGPTRCQQEYELLQTVRHLGVNAPEPVAYAYRGRFCYLGWLITRAIPQPQSLVQLANADATATQGLMPAVIAQISLLIEHRILHVDLHPGNVIIDKAGRAFIVDFDKGRVFPGARKKLRNLYLRRWQRAVRKHGLPMVLIDTLQAGLGAVVDETTAKNKTHED